MKEGTILFKLMAMTKLKKFLAKYFKSVPELEQFKTTHNHLEGI